jgi:hypothetical protein
MTYQEALKKVQANKNKDNFMLIEVNWDNKILLPYKDGLVYLNSLINAESYSDSGDVRIGGIKQHDITCRIMSNEEYEQIKIANLLSISLADVKDMALKGST